MYNRNLSVLKKMDSKLCSLVENTLLSDSFEVVDSKRGGAVLLYNEDGKKKFFHSKIDPVREAERFIGEVDFENHDMFVVYGFASAYHIESLLSQMSEESFLVIIEKELSVLKLMMSHRDLTSIFLDKRLILLVDPKDDSIADDLKGKSSRKIAFLTHRGSFQVFPEYYANITSIIKSYLSTKDVNIATLAKFERIWSSNLARNIKSFASSMGVNSLYGKFSGLDAIVVAAGPSLNDSLPFIKKNMDKAVIVAVDTAYKTLLNNGIIPHFVLAVDPQVINARYFEGVEETSSVLVADPTVHTSVLRMFKGRTIFTGVAFDMLKWIEKIIGSRGEITHGGSVSTNAYDFAKRLGVDRVVIVGQDLAFTFGLAHAKGSYLDEQIHLKTNRFKNSEMFNRFQLTALPKIFVPSIHGGTVQTNQKLMIFLSWFEKRGDESLVNASRGGASIPSVRHVSDEKIIFENLINIDKKIDDLFLNSEKTSFENEVLSKKISLMKDELDELIPLLQGAVAQAKSMIKILKSDFRDQGKLNYILKKMSDVDRVIELKKTVKEIISITTQKVIHTITEGYDIKNLENEKNNDVLIAKKSLFLYEGLLDGAKFNSKILSKMFKILDK